MMEVLRKWNYITREYDVYKVPSRWKVSLYEPDLDTKVGCCHCGKKLPFGDTYTSLEVRNSVGFGYAICKECYSKEIDRRMRYYGSQ